MLVLLHFRFRATAKGSFLPSASSFRLQLSLRLRIFLSFPSFAAFVVEYWTLIVVRSLLRVRLFPFFLFLLCSTSLSLLDGTGLLLSFSSIYIRFSSQFPHIAPLSLFGILTCASHAFCRLLLVQKPRSTGAISSDVSTIYLGVCDLELTRRDVFLIHDQRLPSFYSYDRSRNLKLGASRASSDLIIDLAGLQFHFCVRATTHTPITHINAPASEQPETA